MSLQVVRDIQHKNRSRMVEFAVTSRQISSLDRIMALAGIGKRGPGEHWGWDWDINTGTCTVIQPWMYRGRIDNVLRMVRDKWYPTFLTGLEVKEGVGA